VDAWLMAFINQTLAARWLDVLMPVVSMVGLALCPAVGVAGMVGPSRLTPRPPLLAAKSSGQARGSHDSRIGAAILAALAAGLVVTLSFQYTVLRPRPEGARLVVPAPNFPSFPSGHAMAGFATATVLALATRRGRVAIAAYAGALLLGVSRIYLGHHYPSDVLAGAVIGAGVGAAGYGMVVDSGKRRSRWRWLLWPQIALMIVVSQVAYMGRLPVSVLRLPYTDKVLHFLLFGSVAFWLRLWWGPRRLAGLPLAVVVPFGLAALEEGAQAFSSVRSAGLDDLAADLAGMALFWWLSQRIDRIERRRKH
jgi:undecaprenyl-diphosphatase